MSVFKVRKASTYKTTSYATDKTNSYGQNNRLAKGVLKAGRAGNNKHRVCANQSSCNSPRHRRPDHLLILAGRPPHGSHLPRRFARRNRNLRVTARAGYGLTGKLRRELHRLAAVGADGRCRFIQERKIAHLRNCHPLRTEKQRAGGV